MKRTFIPQTLDSQLPAAPAAWPAAVKLASAVVVLALAGFASAQVRGAQEAKPSQAQPANPPDDPFGDPLSVASVLGVSSASATPPQAMQILIEAKFVEIGQNDFDPKDLNLSRAGTVGPGTAGTSENPWIGQLDVPAVLRVLAQKPSYILVGTPTVVTLSGRNAAMSVGQELRYPRSYSDTGLPQDFDTRKVGVQLQATPSVASDGHTIGLLLGVDFTDFEGFVEYGKKNYQPIFSTRNINTEVSLQDGATLVMGGLMLPEQKKLGDAGSLPDLTHLIPLDEKFLKDTGAPKRTLLIFITAKIVKPPTTVKVTP
jgi:general secretion pathway protein D